MKDTPVPYSGRRVLLRPLLLFLLIHSAVGFSFSQKAVPRQISKDNIIEKVMERHADSLRKVLNDPDRYHLQILYTQINRDSSNRPRFKHYQFHLDTTRYFYPASMAKMPLAGIALEKLFLMGQAGVDKNTRLEIEANAPCQSAVTRDTSSQTGYPSIGHYITKLFAVSDNDAYNRLFEFVGPKHLNERLWTMGYSSARIFHRFSGCDLEGNRKTNAFRFLDANGDLLYRQDPAYYPDQLKNPFGPALVGKARYLDNGQFVESPWDFTYSNFISLWDLHRILISLMFPKSTPPDQRFILMDRDYAFLKWCMGVLPRECGRPDYDPESYYDCIVKYLFYGRSETDSLLPNVRIYNKVGMAFGFLTDCAYIVDYEKKVEFFLSVSMYVNEDETLNDNNYDYYSIGLPFMKNLGRAFYDYEIHRKKRFPPRLEKKPDFGSGR